MSSTYRAKLIVERVETRRPLIRGTEVTKEAVYDQLRIEITGTDPDVALAKVMNLAQAELADRSARAQLGKDRPVTDNVEPDEDEEDGD